MSKPQVNAVIKSDPHVRQVQGDGPGRAGGRHHRCVEGAEVEAACAELVVGVGGHGGDVVAVAARGTVALVVVVLELEDVGTGVQRVPRLQCHHIVQLPAARSRGHRHLVPETAPGPGAGDTAGLNDLDDHLEAAEGLRGLHGDHALVPVGVVVGRVYASVRPQVAGRRARRGGPVRRRGALFLLADGRAGGSFGAVGRAGVRSRRGRPRPRTCACAARHRHVDDLGVLPAAVLPPAVRPGRGGRRLLSGVGVFPLLRCLLVRRAGHLVGVAGAPVDGGDGRGGPDDHQDRGRGAADRVPDPAAGQEAPQRSACLAGEQIGELAFLAVTLLGVGRVRHESRSLRGRPWWEVTGCWESEVCRSEG